MPATLADAVVALLAQRPLRERLWEVFVNYLPLSWITFGGPQRWLSEKTFADIFAISNAIPGPAGTKLAFTLALVRGGLFCGLLAFLMWSIPGGVVMFFFGYGVGRIGESGIPLYLKYIQNGLSSVAVALVALAAYKMGCKILTDNTDRALAIITAAVVINFTSVVWVIPVAMVVGGIVTTLEDRIVAWRDAWRRKRAEEAVVITQTDGHVSYSTFSGENVTTLAPGEASPSTLRQRRANTDDSEGTSSSSSPTPPPAAAIREPVETKLTEVDNLNVSYSLRAGLIAVGIAFLLLILAVAVKSFPDPPRAVSVLFTFYFVGMIIFGGGTVVVPLLYSYVVTPGWLSDSEFLIGLALTNAMPGPNFNFAAYCGALALRGSFGSSIVGGTFAWVGIYASGILLMAGILPIWKQFREVTKVKVAFKGFSSVAVGLVFVATYILIEKAISEGKKGTSLTAYPFYVAVTGISFVVVEFMRVPAPLMVVLGGLIGFGEWFIYVRKV
ncbi:chromate transporter-domain-containing protein [Chytridium lagenaria]|nr:chromate transporter-domain-containing protein [Chytridium lagenaria]